MLQSRSIPFIYEIDLASHLRQFSVCFAEKILSHDGKALLADVTVRLTQTGLLTVSAHYINAGELSGFKDRVHFRQTEGVTLARMVEFATELGNAYILGFNSALDGIDALDTMHNIEMPDGPAPLVLALRRAAQSGYDAGSQITYTWIREVL